jgi:hypothetical protein
MDMQNRSFQNAGLYHEECMDMQKSGWECIKRDSRVEIGKWEKARISGDFNPGQTEAHEMPQPKTRISTITSMPIPTIF